MSAWLTAFPLRLMFAFTWTIVMGWAPWPDPTTGQLPTWFYAVAMCNLVLYRLACNVMFVSQMAFFSRVADPSIGGTYVAWRTSVCSAVLPQSHAVLTLLREFAGT